jgi:hypothetical protein
VPQGFFRDYALPGEALLVAGIERLHQESFVDESVISSVAYIRFWRRFIELQRTGFHSMPPSLRNI